MSSNLIFSVKIVSGKSLYLQFPSNHLSSSRYNNKVSVETRVYKNLKLFMENKEGDDDLFDRLSVRDKFLLIIFSIRYFFFLDVGFESIFKRSDERSYSESLSNV